MRTKGKLIIFEGIEGCGKTTQQKKLHQYLVDNGHSVLSLREPDGIWREKIMALDPNDPDRRMKELHLFMGGRRFNFVHKIIPNLEAGVTVLSDRSGDSTVAYQGYGLALETDLDELRKIYHEPGKKFVELDKEIKEIQKQNVEYNEYTLDLIRAMNKASMKEVIPDLVILLDMEVEIALARRHKKGSGDTNRFDHEKNVFHERVKIGFIKESARDTKDKIKKWVTICGDDTEEVVFEKVKKAVEEKLGL
jgi:dTMP kinase